jgi:hypothetical protein
MQFLWTLRSNRVVATVTKLAIYFVECLFALGIIGSAIVVILTSIEDSEVFFGGNGEPQGASEPQSQFSPQEH